MRTHAIVGFVAAAALAGCGLEGYLSGAAHTPYARPASVVRGATSWAGPIPSQLSVVAPDGSAVAPFDASIAGAGYELRLPSARYAMLVVQARAGNLLVRALLPEVGEESTAEGVNLDAQGMAEALIVEARLSADGSNLKKVTPSAYLATRALIRADLATPGTPANALAAMVGRFLARADPTSGNIDPDFFAVPALRTDFSVRTSPLSAGYLLRNAFDYDGDGVAETDSLKFDAKLAEAARLYRPAGCPDPSRIRLMFTVDFNDGAKNGNGGTIDRFKWAVDKPGKRMFFVGWIHKESPYQDVEFGTNVNGLLGASAPNTIPMYDDGTNGDEVAGDGIWTVYFDVPRVAGKPLRVGYKYTWGTRGAPWTGSEEWPGNSRILEVVDVNGDEFVYRRDVFGDEATNKDNANLSLSPRASGSITWTTDLRGCGPEAREQKVKLHDASLCPDRPASPTDPAAKTDLGYITPQSVGPLTVACTN